MAGCEELKGEIDFAIIAIDEEEMEALLPHCGDVVGVHGDRIYHVCDAPAQNGDSYRLAIARPHVGSGDEIGALADDLLRELDPRWLLVVGAGVALPSANLQVGDVVVSSMVTCVEMNGAGAAEPVFVEPLALAARNVVSAMPVLKKSMGAWAGKDGADRQPLVKSAPIAASRGRVGKQELASIAQEIDAALVERETASIYERASGRCPVLSIRGVQGVAGQEAPPHGLSSACSNAAAFCAALLRAGPIPVDGRKRRSGKVLAQKDRSRPLVWRLIDRQDPMMSALTFFAASLVFIFLSFFIGLNDPSLYGGRQVGYLHAINWALLYTFLAPAYIYLSLSARDELRTLLARLPDSAELEQAWNTRRRRTNRVWWLFASIGLALSLFVWAVTSAGPLLDGTRGDEWDWTVGLHASPSMGDRWINLLFSLCAFLMQALLIAIATAMLTAQAASARLVRSDLPKEAFDEDRIVERFGPLLRRVLIAGGVLIAMLYLARVWRLFLGSDADNVFEFLFQVPGDWLPPSGGALGFGVIAVATLTGLGAIWLPFTVHRRAAQMNGVDGLDRCWPMARPGPVVLLVGLVVALATVVLYWLGAVLLGVFLVYLFYRGIVHVYELVRPDDSTESLGAFLRRRMTGPQSWWFVSLLAAVSAMLLAVVVANVGVVWRGLLLVGVLTFLLVLSLNPRRRFFRLGSMVVGAVLAANALPTIGFGFDVTLGGGDAWAEFINEPPPVEFTVGGFLLAVVFVILDYANNRDHGAPEPVRVERTGAAIAAPSAQAASPPGAAVAAPAPDPLPARYRGLRGAHDWLTALISLGVPAVATESSKIDLQFSYPTVIYLAYHLAGLYVWTQVQDPDRLAQPQVRRRIEKVHHYGVRWLRPATYALVAVTVALWGYAGLTDGTGPLPGLLFDLIGVELPPTS